MTEVDALARAVRAGDRRALSKAITLVESSRPMDEPAARELVSALASSSRASFRIGVTGVPGAGKSTLIDALGRLAIAGGRRVAVLAIDPSSRMSGGSVLGDKTRMMRLATESAAFIRPSPTLGVLGGTAGRSREVILLCEAAGYDLIFVETVGVGQSEERVASMVDCVLLLLLAGAGDELSSMKRGLLEAADLIAFNKADGSREPLVATDAASLRANLEIGRGAHAPEVLSISALEGSGLDLLWSALLRQHSLANQEGTFAKRRALQRKSWFEAALEHALRGVFSQSPELARALAEAERDVETEQISAPEAAQRLVSTLHTRRAD